MRYQRPVRLKASLGNNAFSYDERIKQLGNAELFLTTLKTISSINEVHCGKEIVFEEIDAGGILRQCTGLEHLYSRGKHKIFDNHNHALYFWAEHKITHGAMPVIHIDQHSDLADPTLAIDHNRCNDLDYIREYTNHVCNVGNFIKPSIAGNIISECKQIRTESLLLETPLPQIPYILDIDLDFRAPEMAITALEETLSKTKSLIEKASLVTIATSPYFLKQTTAIELLGRLFTRDQ